MSGCRPKTRGIDLLVTNSTNKQTVSIQVKFSQDYTLLHKEKAPRDLNIVRQMETMSWHNLNAKKLRKSKADLWILVTHSLTAKKNMFLILPPATLYQRLVKIHGTPATFRNYFWVTKSGKCWEVRTAKKKDRILIANDHFKNKDLKFTEYLDRWNLIDMPPRKKASSS